ncbi:hypothetical protein F2981_16690 [Sinorhizobium meliloti]|nr:hypothetical protein [Sinorhizobium meliloti]
MPSGFGGFGAIAACRPIEIAVVASAVVTLPRMPAVDRLNPTAEKIEVKIGVNMGRNAAAGSAGTWLQ